MKSKKEKKPNFKSFYKSNGITLNKQGLEAAQMFNSAIERVYVYWLQRGYSPSQAREMLFTQAFQATTFANAFQILDEK